MAIKVSERASSPTSWLYRCQVHWQNASAFKRTYGYGALWVTTNFLFLMSTPFLQKRGYFESRISFLFDVCLLPLFEEMAFRGFACSFIETIQNAFHLILYKNQPRTEQQLQAQAEFRVNLQSALFALAHYNQGIPQTLFVYFTVGRATGYCFESGGLPQAILCHLGHNLLSYGKFSLSKTRFSPALANHSIYYLVVFWGILKKPIIPLLPSPLRRRCDAVYTTVIDKISAVCQKGWRCFRRIFRC